VSAVDLLLMTRWVRDETRCHESDMSRRTVAAGPNKTNRAQIKITRVKADYKLISFGLAE
jgi:hypothetical protein